MTLTLTFKAVMPSIANACKLQFLNRFQLIRDSTSYGAYLETKLGSRIPLSHVLLLSFETPNRSSRWRPKGCQERVALSAFHALLQRWKTAETSTSEHFWQDITSLLADLNFLALLPRSANIIRVGRLLSCD